MEGMALLELASMLPSNSQVVELGSFCGLSSRYLAVATVLSSSKLCCIDPFKSLENEGEEADEYRPFFQDNIRVLFNYSLAGVGLFNSPHIRVITGLSEEVAKQWSYGKIDMLFVDSNHWRCRQEVEAWMPHLSEYAMIALHDVGNTGKYGIDGPDNTFSSLIQKGWKYYGGRNLVAALTRDPGMWDIRREVAADRGNLLDLAGGSCTGSEGANVSDKPPAGSSSAA